MSAQSHASSTSLTKSVHGLDAAPRRLEVLDSGARLKLTVPFFYDAPSERYSGVIAISRSLGGQVSMDKYIGTAQPALLKPYLKNGTEYFLPANNRRYRWANGMYEPYQTTIRWSALSDHSATLERATGTAESQGNLFLLRGIEFPPNEEVNLKIGPVAIIEWISTRSHDKRPPTPTVDIQRSSGRYRMPWAHLREFTDLTDNGRMTFYVHAKDVDFWKSREESR